MTILNKNVPAIATALEVASNHAPTAYVAFKLLQFRRKLLAIEADLKTVAEKSQLPRVAEFERLRVTCAEKLADKDEAGKPIIDKQLVAGPDGRPTEQGNYRLSEENKAAFKAEMDALEPAYHDDIQAAGQAQVDFLALLESPVDEATLPAADIYKLKIKLFDKLPASVVKDLYEIISEE